MKINFEKLGLFIVLIIFFIPEGMTTVGNCEYTQNVAFINNTFVINATKVMFWMRNIVGIIYCLFQIINVIQSKKIFKNLNKISKYFTVFALWVIVDAWLNKIDLYSILIHMAFCLGFLLLAENSIRKENDWFFKNMLLISKIFLTINLLLIIVFPNGITTSKDYLLTPYYFLGFKNQITPFLIMASLLLFMDFIKKKNFRDLVFFQLIILCNVTLMGSGTGLLCVAVMVIGNLILIQNNKYNSQTSVKMLNRHKFLIVSTIVISIGIVFLNFQKVFQWLVVGILNKDLSLSGRTNTWGIAINQFLNKPILGYGYGHMVIGHYYAHNIILELLTLFGIVGLLLYGIFCIKIFNQYFIKGNQKFSVPIVCATISLIIANTSESFIFNIPQLTIFILIGYYALERKNINNYGTD